MTKNDFLQDLAPTEIVITPHSRLANDLQRQYAERQYQQGHLHWPTPRIYTQADAWQMCFAHIQESAVPFQHLILNPFQTRAIWRKLVIAVLGDQILNSEASLEHALEAYTLMQHYAIPDEIFSFEASEDSQVFFDLYKQFRTQALDHGWHTYVELPTLLLDALPQHHRHLPARWHWCAFDHHTPQTEKFLQASIRYGIHHSFHDLLRAPSSNFQLACEDKALEMACMVQWAVNQHNQGNVNIGCIVSELASQADSIRAAFSQVTDNFDIAQHHAMAEYPIVATALHLLALHTANVQLSNISYVLRSPFIAEGVKQIALHHAVDWQLRQLQRDPISRRDLRSILQRYHPALWERCQAAHTLLERAPRQQRPSAWLELFQSQWQRWGWPGQRELTTEEYQTLQRWGQLCDEFVSLDSVLTTVSAAEARHLLTQLAETTFFQPQRRPAAIQVMDRLEASGLHFDALWIAGCDDTQWPAAAHPNPFIPRRVQQRLEIPHASSQQELTFTRQLLHRLQRSTPHLWASYAKHNDIGPQSPSYFIHNWPLVDATPLAEAASLWRPTAFAVQQFECLEDKQGPAIQAGEWQSLGTGSHLFKWQSQCPFRAFMSIRLHAEPLPQPLVAFHVSQRGQNVHRALELCWQKLQTHEQLIALDEEALQSFIEQTVADTLREYDLPAASYLLEADRLKHLLYRWLLLEKQRLPFSVVAIEQKYEVDAFGIPLRIRCDRVDYIPGCGHVLIDYKTGLTDCRVWLGDRLIDPQLPLYALLHPEPIKAVCFAQLKTDRLAWKGISAMPLPEQAQEVDWSMQTTVWQQQLQQLATDFLNGDATIDPYPAPETCTTCHLQPVCRITTQPPAAIIEAAANELTMQEVGA